MVFILKYLYFVFTFNMCSNVLNCLFDLVHQCVGISRTFFKPFVTSWHI